MTGADEDTLTGRYARIHFALVRTAHENATSPFHCRVLLAVMEAGDDGVTTDELERRLMVDGGHLRGALGDMYEAELALGTGVDGGPRRRGVRTRVTLTERGMDLARQVKERVASEGRANAYTEACPVRGGVEVEPDQVDRDVDDTGFSVGTV